MTVDRVKIQLSTVQMIRICNRTCKIIRSRQVFGRDETIGPFTPEELARTKPDSITSVSVSGKLESALDIRDPQQSSRFPKSD